MLISAGGCIIDISNWFLTSWRVNTVQTIRSEHDNNHQELRQALENDDINGDYSDDDGDDDGDDGGDVVGDEWWW